MHRSLIVAAAVSALVLAGTGVALAQTPTPTPAPECGAAIQAVVTFDGVKKAEDALKTATGTRDGFKSQLAALEVALSVSIKDDNTANLAKDSDKTVGLKAQVKAMADFLANAEKDVTAKTGAVAKAKDELDALAKVRDEVCAPLPGRDGQNGTNGTDGQDAEQNNGGSTSNGSTSTNTDPESTVTYSQVETAPVGGVETGA